MSPAEVTRGLLDTFEAACFVVGFLTLVAIAGGFLDLRLRKKWRALDRDLKQSRWRSLYR